MGRIRQPPVSDSVKAVLTILELDKSMVAVDMELPVLEHDELPALLALLRPAAAVALVLRKTPLTQHGSSQANGTYAECLARFVSGKDMGNLR